MVQTAQGVNLKANNVSLLEAEEVVRTNISIPGIHLITRIIPVLIIVMKMGMEILLEQNLKNLKDR